MNSLLKLKGEFDWKPNSSKPTNPNLKENQQLKLSHLEKLLSDLKQVDAFWKAQKLAINPLISVYYDSIAAKSKRISMLFYNTLKDNNNAVVGVSLTDEINKRHLITYCIEKNVLKNAIDKVTTIIETLKREDINVITNKTLELIYDNKIIAIADNSSKPVSKTQFGSIIVDLSNIEQFAVKTTHDDSTNNKVVTIYKTGTDLAEIFKQLNIDFKMSDRIYENTVYLDEEQYNTLKNYAPFLISMAVDDLNEFDLKTDSYQNHQNSDIIFTIPDPTDEPIIGVIDTMFDESVYFSKWVEFKREISSEIKLENKDFTHGTTVSSIIVDGPTFNKDLDDNCGRFRVRHFGVAKEGRNNMSILYKKIENIVQNNKEIKVWNLSLGSELEIEDNSISLMGELLDRLQYENDVIFVVAGTNKTDKNQIKIGSPADSMNAIVVNSVDFKENPADYSRKGPVLHFFNKPDVSYYGGSSDKLLMTCSQTGAYLAKGTSYAAPWITRKVAYLVYKLKFSKEEAKALIIHSANLNDANLHHDKNLIGYGVVPKKINDIIESKNHETKLLLSYNTKGYYTYNYELPVPTVSIENKVFPFTAKATMVYSTDCSREQGIDYTKNELDLQFGPMKREKGQLKIKSINENKQSEEGEKNYINESEARIEFSKWNNVKVIEKKEKTKTGRLRKPIKVNDNFETWGIKVTKKDRLNIGNNKAIKFSIVITFKSLDKSKNFLEKFVGLCESSQRWYVKRIQVDNQIKIYSKSNEKLEFDV